MLPIIHDTTTIEAVSDLIGQPLFLIDVEGPSAFRFRHMNTCHVSTTGLTNELTAGQRPHDIFPPRLADTIVQNYELCRATGQVHNYEENLDLPSGPRWWQTCLSPILTPSGDVGKILGLALDITEHKKRQFRATERLSEMGRLNADLQVFAASTAQDMRGPFQTMISLLDLVRYDFVDLGDEKGDQLALCSEIAQKAVSSMNGILSAAERLEIKEVARERVDLHHVTSDIAALIDPQERLNIELPRGVVETDPAALQMVLRRLMVNAARYADRSMNISIAAVKELQIEITVSDDGASPDPKTRCDGKPVLPDPDDPSGLHPLGSAYAIVEARAGAMRLTDCAYANGAAITFTLPGELVSEQAKAGASWLEFESQSGLTSDAFRALN